MSIAKGRNGTVLLKCFGGCSIETICHELEISVKDLFPPNPQRQIDPPHIRAEKRAAAATLAALHRRLTARERISSVDLIKTDAAHVDEAIARALAITIEGEICQVVLVEKRACI